MALTREQKEAVVTELTDLLDSSKMTTFASYQGLTVNDMQELRAQARENDSTVKVVKNRLFKLVAGKSSKFKGVDLDLLQGQLVYVFSDSDEVAPAKVLAKFSKANPTLKLVGALSGEGALLSGAEAQALASLPSKQESIAQLISTLSSPLDNVMSGLAGDLHGLLDGVASKATA